MYYRRKILLALLAEFGGELANVDFQKLLFLFTARQKKRSFDFVPYKFGCFSFQSYADKRTLTKNGYLAEKDNWVINNKGDNFYSSLTDYDKEELIKFKKQFANIRGAELVEYVYKHFPYYAIKSEIASDFLNQKGIFNISRHKPKQNNFALFTIGYEGISIESFLNKLIKNNVKVLCDVRKNALSRKYGFSKKQLKEAGEKMDIKYIHIPSLGIISSKRKNLNSQFMYDTLFAEYERTILKRELKSLEYIHQLLKDQKRVALVCFEAAPNQCHRSRVANSISQLPGMHYPVYHL